MKRPKGIQEQNKKLKIKFEKEIEDKSFKKIDNNLINTFPNKRKNLIKSKPKEINNKLLTTESIFKTKNESNYHSLNDRNSNTNPFRKSSRTISKITKKNSSLLNIKKFLKTTINLTSDSKNENNPYKEKENLSDIKKTKKENNEPNLILKKNIFEKQIKNTIIKYQEDKKPVDIKENYNDKLEHKNNKGNIKVKLLHKDEKNDHIIYINKKLNNSKSKKQYKKVGNKNNKIFIDLNKDPLKNKIEISNQNGMVNQVEKFDNSTKVKNGKNIINIENKDQKEQVLPQNKKIYKYFKENEFQIIGNNSNTKDINKNNENKVEIDLNESKDINNEEKDSLIYNKEENFLENILEKEQKANIDNNDENGNREINSLDNINNNIVNNGKNIIPIDINKNINGNSDGKIHQNYVDEKNNTNNLENMNNGLESKNNINYNEGLSFENNEKEICLKKNNFESKIIQKQNERLGKIVKEGDELSSKDKANTLSNIINNIQDLIFQSKNKIEKDLYEIEKKEKKNDTNLNISKETKKYQKSKRKNLDKGYNKINIKIKNSPNKHQFNQRYITDSNFKENKIIEKEKSFEHKNKKKLFQNKINNKINNIKESNYKNNINVEHLQEEKNNQSSKVEYKGSLSIKKNKYIKYNDLDLNTLFPKSTKNFEKDENKNQYIKSNEYQEENGGIININDENGNKEYYETMEAENLKFKENDELTRINISTKNKHYINNVPINENNNEEKKEIENNELININEELKNEIYELKKEVEFSKKEMKKKDEKILKYLDKYDKIISENALNMAEIENLEEELKKNKNEMYIKTKKIKELTDKNNGLEQEMNQLKIFYKKDNYIYEYSKKNDKIYNKDLNLDNKKGVKEKQRKKDINNEKTDENFNLEDLNIEELQNKRNELIQERNNITILYNKLPIKLVSKEQFIQKQDLENRLNKVNNYLMQIRLELKKYNQ